MSITTRRAAKACLLIRHRGRFSTGTNPAVSGQALPVADPDEWYPVVSAGKVIAHTKGIQQEAQAA